MKIKYKIFNKKSLLVLWRHSVIIAILICCSQTIFAQSPLCKSYPQYYGYEYVSSVSINGQVQQGDNGYSGPGYFDFTASSVTSLVAGQTYPISVTVVTNSSYLEYVKIWFDFNGNLNLQDSGELIFDQYYNWSGTHTFSGTFTVPTTAYNGDLYLRVNMVYSKTPALCGTYNYGNTLDFKASISGGVPPHKLSVSTVGPTGYIGNITSSPEGINTASGFNFANFAEGTSVTLTETNATNGSFINWSGDIMSTNKSISVGMDVDKNITANFGSASPPVASAQNITVSLDGNGAKTITGADVNNGSTADCGIASFSVSPSSFTCGQIGANNVYFTVNDKCGKSSTVTVIVTVVDNIPPTVVTKPVTITLDASGHASVTAADVNNNSTDNCGISSYSLNKTSFNYSNQGSNIVTLTVLDNNNNSATNFANVTVLANGLNSYGQLATDGNAQTNQYGAKALGVGKTQNGQIFGSSIAGVGGLLPLNFITYDETGSSPAIPAAGAQLSTGSVPNINYYWNTGAILNSGKSSNVQVHFTGNVVWPGIAGINKSVTFYDQSSDGFKMSVNSTLIIDNYIDQIFTQSPSYNSSGSISLVAGQTYPIDIWYYDNVNASKLQLYWDTGDGNGIVIVPAVKSTVVQGTGNSSPPPPSSSIAPSCSGCPPPTPPN